MMNHVKSDFLRVSMERGFFHQCSDLELLDQQLSTNIVPAYIGFDCTATSFHVGNLVQIMRLYWLQNTGHKPIVLMGGGTSRVGDPSGKDKTRQMLSLEKIEENKNSLQRAFAKFLKFGKGKTDAIMVDNAEWITEIPYIDLLRDVGRHFSVNRMIAMESVKGRLDREQEMSFIEFNYMILQAYDFVELNRRYGCTLQMGGSDQWGNIVSGVDLARRMGIPNLAALTCELITTSDGKKMGKTADGAVWLDEQLLSPYEYWQYWRNTNDLDVGRFLRLFTTIELDEIARLEKCQGSEINEAKRILATEATALLHGRDAAIDAQNAADGFFTKGKSADANQRVLLKQKADIEDGLLILHLLMEANLIASNNEGKRLISEGAIRINDETVCDPGKKIELQDFHGSGELVLSRGRKKHFRVKLDAST